ncbi:MAG: hypothetical protein AAF830_02670 [Pseudomonadota bacterium]
MFKDCEDGGSEVGAVIRDKFPQYINAEFRISGQPTELICSQIEFVFNRLGRRIITDAGDDVVFLDDEAAKKVIRSKISFFESVRARYGVDACAFFGGKSTGEPDFTNDLTAEERIEASFLVSALRALSSINRSKSRRIATQEQAMPFFRELFTSPGRESRADAVFNAQGSAEYVCESHIWFLEQLLSSDGESAEAARHNMSVSLVRALGSQPSR